MKTIHVVSVSGGKDGACALSKPSHRRSDMNHPASTPRPRVGFIDATEILAGQVTLNKLAHRTVSQLSATPARAQGLRGNCLTRAWSALGRFLSRSAPQSPRADHQGPANDESAPESRVDTPSAPPPQRPLDDSSSAPASPEKPQYIGPCRFTLRNDNGSSLRFKGWYLVTVTVSFSESRSVFRTVDGQFIVQDCHQNMFETSRVLAAIADHECVQSLLMKSQIGRRVLRQQGLEMIEEVA